MAINTKYGYVRVSSKSQESNYSIEFQKQQLIQNGIQAKNIRVDFYTDPHKNLKRSHLLI